jgi:hypothetical protein
MCVWGLDLKCALYGLCCVVILTSGKATYTQRHEEKEEEDKPIIPQKKEEGRTKNDYIHMQTDYIIIIRNSSLVVE